MKLSWRVRLTILAAVLVTIPSLENVLRGYNGWDIYLEHLLVALVLLYVLFWLVSAIIAWYHLENLQARRRQG